MYAVMAEPPSLAGAFHDSDTLSSLTFSTTRKRGGDGLSVIRTLNSQVSEPRGFSSRSLYVPDWFAVGAGILRVTKWSWSSTE
jgi:hypothetical protein